MAVLKLRPNTLSYYVVLCMSRLFWRIYPFKRGLWRILRYSQAHLSFDAPVVQTSLKDGTSIQVFPNDLIGHAILVSGQYEPVVPSVIKSYALDGDVFLDIGANIGYVSAAMLSSVPRLRVVAVEPQPRVYQLLTENLSVALHEGKAMCINSAISSESGRKPMAVWAHNFGAGHLTDNEEVCDSDLVVDVISGDQLLEALGDWPVNLIKIDVEGHEDVVIPALHELLVEKRPRVIVFENNDGSVCGTSSPIRRELESLGYRLFGIQKRLFGHCLVALGAMVLYRRITDYIALLPEG